MLQYADMISAAHDARSLAVNCLFSPASVAVVGASADPGKWGHLLARGALAGEHRRAVYLVSRRGGELLGGRVLASVLDVPSPPELVVLSVTPDSFEQAVDEALGVGARAIVGVTAGHDTSPELVERVRAASAVLLGPNCLGVYDGEAELLLAPWLDFPPGEIGLIAQSGNLALELGLLFGRAGLGCSRFASLGNQADLEAADLLANLAAHDGTQLIALYIEDFREGRRFASAAREAVAAGKHVVLLAAGSSEAGARAARSHTGALVSDSAAVDAACRAAGIVRVSTPQELVDVAHALLDGRPARGRRVAVFGDGGGHGVIAADLATHAGLELPVLSKGVQTQLASVLRSTASTANPVDFAGGEEDLNRFEQVSRILLDSGEVDALLLTGYFGGYGSEVGALGEQEVAVAAAVAQEAAARHRTLVVHTLYPDSPAAGVLRERGALVYREIERAVGALRVLTAESRLGSIPPVTSSGPDAAGDDYFSARNLVAAAGVRLPEARRARDADEVRAAARELGYPLVLKSLAHNHKSDGNGVVLGLETLEELEAAYWRIGPECSVERMEQAVGVELIVGVRRDPRFGPLLLVGLGGIHAELLQDVSVGLAPASADEAETLVRSLRAAPLLDGTRGHPPLDVRATAEAAAALSLLASSMPSIQELEVNPLLITREGAVALDARVVLAEPARTKLTR
jgi:acyl-CoA synthetase (NDP forming)